jgi:hypothetical protein
MRSDFERASGEWPTRVLASSNDFRLCSLREAPLVLEIWSARRHFHVYREMEFVAFPSPYPRLRVDGRFGNRLVVINRRWRLRECRIYIKRIVCMLEGNFVYI